MPGRPRTAQSASGGPSARPVRRDGPSPIEVGSLTIPDQTASGPSLRESLDRSLLSGIAWTGGGKWVVQALSWVSTLVVARLLSPDAFGLIGMALVYHGFAQFLGDFGIGIAIIQLRHLDEQRIARLGGLSAILGLTLAGVSVAVSGGIAWFFGEPIVGDLISVLSLVFVATALEAVPRSLMTRDLEFPRLTKIEVASSLLHVAVTVALAASGFGVWALVAGPLTGRFASMLLMVGARPHRLAWPWPLPAMREEVTFGWRIFVAQIGWYVYSNADFAVVGRFLGKTALGAYSIGWQMASIPVDRVSVLIARVTTGVFSAAQAHAPILSRYLTRLTAGLAVITFPISVGLALVGDDFIMVFLGNQWSAAILPLRLLAVYAGIRSVGTLFGPLLVAARRERLNMAFNAALAVLLPALFLLGIRWGLPGVAVGWIVGYPLVAVPGFLRAALAATGTTWGEYARALWPATEATLAMTGVVLAVRTALPAESPALRLVSAVVAGAAAYAAYVWWRYRSLVLGTLNSFRAAMR